MTMENIRYPSSAELYALEARARRERAEAMGRLIIAAAAAIKSFFVRLLAVRGPSASDVQKQVAHHA
jgi:hypothetical protein